MLLTDLENVPENDREKYVADFRAHLTAWLSAQSRCASSFITGGAGFNVARAEKANRSEQNRYDDFMNWRERAKAAIQRQVQQAAEAAKSPEQKLADRWAVVKAEIDNVFVKQLLYDKLERIALKGDTEMIAKAVDYVRELNATRPRPIFTERHKFFKLPELAERFAQKKADNAERENSVIEVGGVKIVQNWQADRLQIVFDGKPPYATIALLKKHGFKWAPSAGVWQRQNTPNAVYSLKHFVLPALKAE
jgi:hypothetical protein